MSDLLFKKGIVTLNKGIGEFTEVDFKTIDNIHTHISHNYFLNK